MARREEILVRVREIITAVGWSLGTKMAGMAIMFVASALNLRKQRAGFDRLSRGETDPRIPRVWCSVLTMATEAAIELQRSRPAQNPAPNASR